MCRRISSAGSRAPRSAGRSAPPRPPCATWPSISRTSSSDLVPRAEGDQFLKGVDTLREDVDRLEARHRRCSQPTEERTHEAARARAAASRSSACCSGTGSTTSSAPLIYIGRCASCSFSRPGIWFERRRKASRGERLRLALEELGPIFVKFGQAVSTRRDLLPLDIADELAKLQDRVPPFPGSVARAIIERAYGKPVEQVFSEFDETPLAAASIAQVHVARAARPARR